MPIGTWKPKFDMSPGGGVFASGGTTITVFDSDGNEIFSNSTPTRGSEGSKWTIPIDQVQSGYYFTIDGGPQQIISDPYNRLEYGPEGGDPIRTGGAGSLGVSGAGTGVGGFAPGNFGGMGYFPTYLGGMFPSPSLIDYEAISKAPYTFTDPLEFAQKYGPAIRDMLKQNYALAKEFGLDQIDTELEGLLRFVPQAGNLAREQTAIDNAFNQDQRTRQIDSALPGVRGDLEGQAGRARAFAEGRVPDEITDRALELGIRSRAADRASVGGFGASSLAGQKMSDLMSAEQRVALSQYGDQLLTGNIRTKADVLLAPTEYANVGSQVRVMPEMSAASRASQMFSEVNQFSLIPASQALQTTVQQNQFDTSLEQQTRQFNASNTLAKDQFNASTENQFKLEEFGYNVSYAGVVAGAAQTASNTAIQLQQQQQAMQIFSDFLNQAQGAQGFLDLIKGVTGGLTALNSLMPGLLQDITAQIGQGIGTAISEGIGVGTDIIEGAGDIVSDVVEGGGDLLSDIGDAIGFSQPTGPVDPAQIPDSFDLRTVNVPAGEAIPRGYESVGINQAGETIAAPIQVISPEVRSFTANTGIEVPRPIQRSLQTSSNAALESSGVYSKPVQGTVRSGVNLNGNATYSSVNLLNSNQPRAGGDYIKNFANVVTPFRVLDSSQYESLNRIGTAATSDTVMRSLNESYERGDDKAFADTLLKSFNQPSVDALAENPKNAAALHGAYGAMDIFQNWGKMSPAQKSLAIANNGLSTFNFEKGSRFGRTQVVPPLVRGKRVITPGMNMAQATQLLQNGVNAYAMAKRWDQIATINKIAGGQNTVGGMAQTSQQFDLLGVGTEGAAVPVDSTELARNGWKPVPNLGVGAVRAFRGATLPNGYVRLNQTDTEEIAIPIPNLKTSPEVPGSSTSLLDQASGFLSLIQGVKKIYDGWGQQGGGVEGAIEGAKGGSAAIKGLQSMGVSNPYVYAAVMAASIIGGAVKVGKSGPQQGRDGMRKRFQDVGLANDDFQVALADGTIADIGIDGHGGMHEVTDRSKLTKEHGDKTELRAYETDYTNDLDYTSALGSIALSRIVSGRKDTQTDQFGSQLGNAALGRVGFGGDFTRENYDTVMKNQRSMYAKAGISSKSDAYQLANQMYAEGRINESDLVSMQQSFDLVFDENSYDRAQSLMSGRHRGIEVASETAPFEEQKQAPKIPVPTSSPNTGTRTLMRSRDAVISDNNRRYSQAQAA